MKHLPTKCIEIRFSTNKTKRATVDRITKVRAISTSNWNEGNDFRLNLSYKILQVDMNDVIERFHVRGQFSRIFSAAESDAASSLSIQQLENLDGIGHD